MDEALIEAEDELSSMYGRDDLIMKELRHMRISMVENKESDKVLLRDLAVRRQERGYKRFRAGIYNVQEHGRNLEKIMGP